MREPAARNLARVRLLAHAVHENGESTPLGLSHPAQRLLDHPNPHWSRYRFWYMAEASLALFGSAPVAIFRRPIPARDGDPSLRRKGVDSEGGEPSELWWLHPAYFKVVPHPTEYIRGYLYDRAGVVIAFKPEDIIWFRHPNPQEEYAGLSPVAPLRMSIDTTVDAIRFNRRFFGNDATPGRVYLKVNGDLSNEKAEDLRLRWEAAFKDQNKAHRLAVLDSGSELKALGMAPRDMEFVNGQVYTREEIAAAYGISPILLGDLRFASLNNSQIAKASFWDETMAPKMALIEAELNMALLPQFETGRTHAVGEPSCISSRTSSPHSRIRANHLRAMDNRSSGFRLIQASMAGSCLTASGNRKTRIMKNDLGRTIASKRVAGS